MEWPHISKRDGVAKQALMEILKVTVAIFSQMVCCALKNKKCWKCSTGFKWKKKPRFSYFIIQNSSKLVTLMMISSRHSSGWVGDSFSGDTHCHTIGIRYSIAWYGTDNREISFGKQAALVFFSWNRTRGLIMFPGVAGNIGVARGGAKGPWPPPKFWNLHVDCKFFEIFEMSYYSQRICLLF